MAGIPAPGSRPHRDPGTPPYLLSVVVETWNEDPSRSIRLETSLTALARQTVPIERC